MNTVLVGIGAFLLSGMVLLLIGLNLSAIVPGLTGLLSLVVGIAAALWYREKVAKPNAEKEKAQTELMYSIKEESVKLRESTQEPTSPEVTGQAMEREKLSHTAEKDNLNEAVKLDEFLLKFSNDDLEQSIRFIAAEFLPINNSYVMSITAQRKFMQAPSSRQQDKILETRFKQYPGLKEISELLEGGVKEELTGWILGLLNGYNMAVLKSHMSNINKGKYIIQDDSYVRPIFALHGVPRTSLEKIALAHNIDITTRQESKLGFFDKLFSEDKLPLLIKIVENISEKVVSKTVAQGISPFCPDSSKKAPEETDTSSTCPECNKSSPKEASHCMFCGRKLPLITCAECETVNPPEAKFCMGCGEKR